MKIAKQNFLSSVLREGEKYAGIILGKNGSPDHHLILLPGQAIDVDHKAAQEFAAKAGGELPTRREQSLLFTNLKEEFEDRWYWSGELHASDASYAWYQDFGNGSQSSLILRYGLRARAVRRVAIGDLK